MNAKIKYLKDESGNKFSPVTSLSSIYDGTTKLGNEVYKPVIVWEGGVKHGSITLSSSISEAKFLDVFYQREFRYYMVRLHGAFIAPNICVGCVYAFPHGGGQRITSWCSNMENRNLYKIYIR